MASCCHKLRFIFMWSEVEKAPICCSLMFVRFFVPWYFVAKLSEIGNCIGCRHSLTCVVVIKLLLHTLQAAAALEESLLPDQLWLMPIIQVLKAKSKQNRAGGEQAHYANPQHPSGPEREREMCLIEKQTERCHGVASGKWCHLLHINQRQFSHIP